MGVVAKRRRPVTVTVAALIIIVGTIFLAFLPLIYGTSVDYRDIALSLGIGNIWLIGLLRLSNFFRWFIGVMYVATIAIGGVYYSLIAPPTTLDIIRLITGIIMVTMYLFLITTPSAREAFRKEKTAVTPRN